MRKDWKSGAGPYLLRKRRHRIWLQIVSSLACVVVFCTVYALILPAITAENTPQCGQEEHTHTETCYAAAEGGQTPVCTPESLGLHRHSAACYDAAGALICGDSDFMVHRHDMACYDPDGNLWCPLPEIEEHTHTDACYETAAEPLPASTEPVHTHTEACYTTEQGELTCTVPEGDGAHAHSAEACYDETGALICQLEESSGHQHADACYAQERTLICTLPTEAAEPAPAEPAPAEPTQAEPICGRPEIILHQHGPECYDAAGALICGQIQVLAHQHTDACFQTAEETEPGQLTCQLEEHTHTAECFLRDGLTAEEWAQVDGANALIDALPGREEIEGKLSELEAAGDEAGYEAYLTQLVQAVKEAQAAYDALTEPQRQKITNAQRLEELAWLLTDNGVEPTDTIALGETKNLNLSGTTPVGVSFTPEYTHEYVFTVKETRGSSYYNVLLSDEMDHEIARYNSRGYYTTTTVTATLEKDVCYELDVSLTSTSSSVISFTVTVTAGKHDFKSDGQGGVVCGCGATQTASGSCGPGLTWKFENGKLTISGSGWMTSYSWNTTPWYPIREYITSVVVESGVTSIGNNAFNGCSNLTDVELPATLTAIRESVFSSCDSLEHITIPDGVTSIGSQVFDSCTKLTDVTLPARLTYLGSGAFRVCKSLTAITIPAGVTAIGNSTFYQCPALTDVTIPEGVKSIGSSVFQLCENLRRITLPDTLTSIGSQAFLGCTSLKELRIPSGVTEISGNAFERCSALETIRWDAASASIKGSISKTKSSFRVVLGDSVKKFTQTELEKLIEMGCTGLELPKNAWPTLTPLKASFVPPALGGMPEGDNLCYLDSQGVLYRIEGNSAYLVYCPPEVTGTYTVPATLTAEGGETYPVVGVDSYAFQGAALTALTFENPGAITTLKDFAFCSARDLASINGASTAEGVLETFTGNPQTGLGLFENTKITGESTAKSGAIEINKHGLLLMIQPPKEGQHPDWQADAGGVFPYYTGESVETELQISQPSGGDPGTVVARVYYRMDDKKGGLDYLPGEYPIMKGNTGTRIGTLKVFATSAPNCYCLEIRDLAAGETVGLKIHGIYPSPTSGGGSATVWGAILTQEEAEALGDGLPEITESHSFLWETRRNDFTVAKQLVNSDSLKINGNGKNGAYLNGLSYEIKLTPPETSLEGGLGADYVSSVDFIDTLVLPEGAGLTAAVQDAVQSGRYTVKREYNPTRLEFRLEDGTIFLTIESLDYLVDLTPDGSVGLNGQDLEIRWRYKNKSTTKEIGALPYVLSVADSVVEFKNVPEMTDGGTLPVTNRITALQHHTWSGDASDQAEHTGQAKLVEGKLALSKRFGEGDRYTRYDPGQTFPVTITAENPGTGPYTSLAALEDPMPDYVYLSAEQLAEAFAADTERQLTVTINNATLCTPLGGTNTVYGTDGGTEFLRQQNTAASNDYSGCTTGDSNLTASGATLTLTWAEGNQIQITSTGGLAQTCAPTAGEIQAALENLGYLVTRSAQYTLRWDLPENYELVGGEKIEKRLNVTFKDTFMLLNQDALGTMPKASPFSGSYVTAVNTVTARDVSNTALTSARVTRDMACLFTSLDKSWSFDGKEITADSKLKADSVLDYQLTVKEPGDGTVGLLPLVDQMTGAQALLVPKDLNQGADWVGQATEVAVDTVYYYRLDKAYTYNKVWTTRGQMADRVEVTETADGLTTRIYWYLLDFKGPCTKTIRYRAQVRPDLTTGISYFLYNESWLGDHESHRLYADVGRWNGTVVQFSKAIVPEAEKDTARGETHSAVSEGERVTYRLRLEALQSGQGQFVLKGSDIIDRLPKSISGHQWSKENVEIVYSEGDSCQVTNPDHWSVETVSGDQQQIQWADDFGLTFTDRADIYVTLTFPTAAAWEAYAKAYGTTGLTNTFSLLGAETSVTHDLVVAAKARLQKSVYGGGYKTDACDVRPGGFSGRTDGRFYYSSRVSTDYGVLYCVSLCNDGPTRLYLTEMQDRLPRGFTLEEDEYKLSYNRNNLSNTSYDASDEADVAEVYKADGTKAALMNVGYTITPGQIVDGVQYATIRFRKCEKDNSVENPASYDAERGLCYLDPGQAIVFTYLCNTNDAADTDPRAENTIAMAYRDSTGGGIELAGGSTVMAESETYTPNNGDCLLVGRDWASARGFSAAAGDSLWLASQVSVQRGEIKPGITKKLASATTSEGGGTTTQDPVWVSPVATLNWEVTADNGGDQAIMDYVLTDVMQAPYQFCESKVKDGGYFTYEIRHSDDIGLSNPVGNWKLFRPISWNGDSVTIEARFGSSATATEGTVNLDTVVALKASRISEGTDLPFQLRFSRNSDGNLVMSLYLEGTGFSIPAGGKGVLALSTVSSNSALTNKQFRNTAYITPSETQPWDGMPNHGSAAELTTPFTGSEALPSVRNSALATTAYGYLTSSSKSVTELDDPSTNNTAACTDDPNYIVLSDKGNAFAYTLTVDNVTGDSGRAIGHLVLIDHLPEANDHAAFDKSEPRGSQFKVSLADNPSPAVTVTPQGGASQTLDPDQYRLEYSTETEFTNEDWAGTVDGTRWSTTATADCRSVRLVILDADATGSTPLLPANSSVSLSFRCRVDAPAEVRPGQIAWNDFGYRYKMAGNENSHYLEAAPLQVGVKIPAVPKLVKKLEDHGGRPVTAEQPVSFTFLLHEGEALPEESYATEASWQEALAAKKYTTFTVTVEEGKSQSEPLMLEAADWTWVKNQRYTVVELLPEDSNYSLRGFGAGEQQSYTFTYNPAVDQTIACNNLSLTWAVELTKKGYASQTGGTEDPVLPGAVFALYSPAASDAITDADLAPFSDLTIERTLTRGEKTWYLKAVGETDINGTLSWENLTQESYYLVEVKAPDGYILPETTEKLLERIGERQGVLAVVIHNSSGGYELPQTGGSGVYWQTFCGLVLMAGPLVCWIHKRRRGAENRN